MDHLPVPIGQFHARRGGRLLHRRPQRRLPRLAEGGGEPPDCSKIKAAGPPSPKAAAHRPIVWGSRSRASAVAEAVHPWASRRRASVPAPGEWAPESSADASPWHPSAIVRETGQFPSRPSPTPHSHSQKLTLSLRQFTPCSCTFHLGFGLGPSTLTSGGPYRPRAIVVGAAGHRASPVTTMPRTPESDS